MKQIIYLFYIFLLSSLFVSCEDEIVIKDLSCSLQTIQHDIDNDTITVTYKIEGQGNFSVSSWSYQGLTGEITVLNPAIPAEVTLIFFGKALPKARAEAKVIEGAVKISYTAAAADSTYLGIDQCQQQIN
jgi:hypothetical protein